MLTEVKMSVMSGDRGRNVEHRFTVYLHSENLTNDNQSNEPTAPQTFTGEGLEHCPWCGANRRHSLPRKPCHLDSVLSKGVQGRTFGGCVKFRMEAFKGVIKNMQNVLGSV